MPMNQSSLRREKHKKKRYVGSDEESPTSFVMIWWAANVARFSNLLRVIDPASSPEARGWCNSCGGISAEKSFYHLIARGPMNSDKIASSSKAVKLKVGNVGVCMRECSI